MLVGQDTGNSVCTLNDTTLMETTLLLANRMARDSTMTTKTYCAPCNLQAKNSGEARGCGWGGRWYDGKNWGGEWGMGTFLLSYFPMQSTYWHLNFAVIKIFGVRHIKCKVIYLLIIWEVHSPQQEVLWGRECGVGRFWCAGGACSAHPPDPLRHVGVTTWALPTQTWASEVSPQS